jgi:hypothetical protein
MRYKCPICVDYTTGTSDALCIHIMNTADKPSEHLEWVEAQGINYLDLVMKSDYAPLVRVVKKKCRIDR